MAMNTRLVDNVKFVWGAAPKNYSGAAMAEQWVSLKNFNHITFVIQTGAWAGSTAAVTINQATAVAGTSSKALGFSRMFTNVGNTSSDVLVDTTVASNTFNLNTANTLYVIEIDTATLDVDNAFDCITLEIASPGSNADLYSVNYILSGARYPGQVLNQPSALVN